MNVFDQTVSMYLKSIKNDMVTMTVLTVLTGVVTCVPGLFSLFMPVVTLFVVTIFSYKAYYKVIYKSMQGDDAMFYTMMPVSSGQQVLSRATALGIFQLLALLLFLVYGFVAMKFSILNGLTTGLLDAIEFIGEQAGIPVLVIEFLDLWASVFACIMILIFFSVKYKKKKDEGESGKVIGAGLIGFLIFNSLKSELLVLMDSSFWLPVAIAELLLDFGLTVVFYKAAVKAMERKDGGYHE